MQVIICLLSPILSVAATVQAPQSVLPMIKDAHRKLHSTHSNPVASSDVVRPSNLIQQTPYIHHPSILYGNPPGITSGQLVNPVSVVPTVVAPPLQTQLHHGCGVVVSQTVPNGNAVNCQSSMESQGGCGKWVCLESCEGVSERVRFLSRCVEGCEECVK